MDVTVKGALRFKHRPALQRGKAAFESEAYPEYFSSALWTFDGLHAFCDETFEIEVDCDHKRAFMAMAREAVEGTIDMRESDQEPSFVRISKMPKPINCWSSMELDERCAPKRFGAPLASFRKQWAADIQKSRGASASSTRPTSSSPIASGPTRRRGSGS